MRLQQKHQLIAKLITDLKDHLEEQREIWEDEGYNKKELYHIVHREMVRLYGHHVREYEEQTQYMKGGNQNGNTNKHN